MKPISIELEGFGAYYKPQKVDFTNLDDLFVISGETGSGKTTIFDGLSYALYGKPLGTREPDMIRSTQSTEEENTIVRLRFQITKANNTTEFWEVERSPYFRESNKRGTGYKKAAKRCLLYRINNAGTSSETMLTPTMTMTEYRTT